MTGFGEFVNKRLLAKKNLSAYNAVNIIHKKIFMDFEHKSANLSRDKKEDQSARSNRSLRKEKVNVWFFLSFILVVALGFAILKRNTPEELIGPGGETHPIVDANEAGQELVDFINFAYGDRIDRATLSSVEEESGLYKVNLVLEGQGEVQEGSLYITKDVQLFIPQLINIEEMRQKILSAQNQIPEEVGPAPAEGGQSGDGSETGNDSP